jgi:hypothetical protein
VSILLIADHFNETALYDLGSSADFCHICLHYTPGAAQIDSAVPGDSSASSISTRKKAFNAVGMTLTVQRRYQAADFSLSALKSRRLALRPWPISSRGHYV